MKDVIATLSGYQERGQRAALATIVNVEGSAYRREGVRAVISENGLVNGVLSGGCVESDLKEHALEVIRTGKSQLFEYDFRADDDLLWGLGVGCDGAVTVWVQPFDPVNSPETAQQILNGLRTCSEASQPYLLGTVIESEDPTVVPTNANFTKTSEIALDELKVGLRDVTIRSVRVRLFVEKIAPIPNLVVIGAGPDALPLAQQASTIGWNVMVVDHRPDYTKADRFGMVDSVLRISRDNYTGLSVPHNSNVVVITHNYEIDKAVLRSMLVNNRVIYLGVLGSRRRIARMLTEISPELSEAADFGKLHAPIGLDTGAESPEEIAVSILAEIMSRKNRREGTSLHRWTDTEVTSLLKFPQQPETLWAERTRRTSWNSNA